MLTMKNSVSNKIIQLIFKPLSLNGIDIGKIKNNFNISDYEIHKEGGRIPEDLYFKIISHIDYLVGKELIRPGETIKSLDVGNMHDIFPDFLGYCINSTSAKEAVDKFICYRAIIGNCDQLLKHEDQSEISIIYNNLVYGKELAVGAIPNFAIIFNLIKCFSMSKPKKIHFMGPPVYYSQDLNDFFGINCEWNKKQNCLILDKISLTEHSANVNPLLKDLQKIKLIELMTSIYSHNDLSSYIYDILVKKINSGNMNDEHSIQEDICSELNLSRWTLYRRLEMIGDSFGSILKKARLNQSYYYLLDTEKNIQEISELTGFSSPTSFTRFFSGNVGISPFNYRKSNKKV